MAATNRSNVRDSSFKRKNMRGNVTQFIPGKLRASAKFNPMSLFKENMKNM
jgi:hypothetical protein